MATSRRIEISTDQWSVVVTVQTCDSCYMTGDWWKRRLWQSASGLLHRVSGMRAHTTACGLPLPTDLPETRLRFEADA